MKIYFAGATRVFGKQLLPKLTNTGYKVMAITRSDNNVEEIRNLSANTLNNEAATVILPVLTPTNQTEKPSRWIIIVNMNTITTLISI